MTKILDVFPSSRARALLVTVAVAFAAVAVTTVTLRGGVSYINLDSLLLEPGKFLTLVVLPTLVAVACVMVSALPVVVTVSVSIMMCLLAFLEAGAWLLAPPRPVMHGEPEPVGTSRFYVPDVNLGYVMAPSTSARHRRTVNDRQVYDVLYRTNAWGRRETPTSDQPKHGFLLFFGDSNTFGEGLSQTETLPYYAGEVAKAYRPYNYGVSGYGPSNLLALARRGGLRQEVAEREGYAIFFFIPAHVGRVIGSSQMSTGWGRHFPHFVKNARGDLVSDGDFVHGRPFTTLAYFAWTKSNLADYFGVDLPLWYTGSDYQLTAKVFKESGRLLAEQLNLRGFVVVLGQVYNEPQRHMIHELQYALARERVSYLDYTGLFDTRDPQYRLSQSDYHNSALANRIIATRLVADLAARHNRTAPVRGRSVEGGTVSAGSYTTRLGDTWRPLTNDNVKFSYQAGTRSNQRE